MNYEEAWWDLRGRLTYADATLQKMVVDIVRTDPNFSSTEVIRLSAKVEGIRLGLSYMDDWERTNRARCAGCGRQVEGAVCERTDCPGYV